MQPSLSPIVSKLAKMWGSYFSNLLMQNINKKQEFFMFCIYEFLYWGVSEAHFKLIAHIEYDTLIP